MSTIPLIPSNRMLRDGSWLFEAPEDGTDAIRESCAAKILEDEVFWHYGELPQRMQASMMTALRGADTEANDREIGRVLRAAMKRAVDEAVTFVIDRMKNEAAMDSDD